MIQINIGRRDYEVGDLAVTHDRNGRSWLVEVLGRNKIGYNARLTMMTLNKETGKYSVERHVKGTFGGTYGGVSHDQMRKIRPEEIDFQSLADWQKYVETEREKTDRVNRAMAAAALG